jgi:hypothetical protein
VESERGPERTIVHKLPNQRASKFTQISNSAIDDIRLTIMDVGLLAEYLRHSDGWTVTLDIIHRKHPSQGRRGCGREALGAAFQNLHQLGYIVKVTWRTEQGHWHTGIAVYDSPATAEEVEAVVADAAPEEAVEVRCETPHLELLISRKSSQVESLRVTKPQVTTETRLAGPRPAEPRQARVPNKTRRKTSLSSSSDSSAGAPEPDPGQPRSGHEDDEEKTTAPPAGQTTAERHPHTDETINQMGWPKGKMPRGRDLGRVRDAVSLLLHRGWTQQRVGALVYAKVNWPYAIHPVAVVLAVLKESADDPSAGRTPVEEAIESLKAEIEAQRAAVAVCGGCDRSGLTEDGWHGHGRRGLGTALWELENPEKAALNSALNAKSPRVA